LYQWQAVEMDKSAVQIVEKGRFIARLAQTECDLKQSQSLRFRAFRCANHAVGHDADGFDARCDHILVQERASGRIVCSYRLLPITNGRDIWRTYSAQFYELSALERFDGPMLEIGRFCIDPDFAADPDILRLAWAALTQFVDHNGVQMLFGCSSFTGTDSDGYLDAFAMLKERHLAPARWLPKVKAPDVFRFARRVRHKPDAKRAMMTMPPLLRTYLLMGGWVSDHAVVDRDLNTLHVFTGLEISAIPASRAKALRAVAG